MENVEFGSGKLNMAKIEFDLEGLQFHGFKIHESKIPIFIQDIVGMIQWIENSIVS